MAASNQEAMRWLRGSFSSLLFPEAQLPSQRVSELLARVGEEPVVRDFFSRYLNVQLPQDKKTGILIDSTGLPNAIHVPLTAVSNHNGEVSEEVRLIFVVDTKTGLPLFFRYNAGNIVDITTLKATLDELGEYGVSISHAIVDAGYCSEENIKALYGANIHFLTRLPVNRKLFMNALSQYREEVLSEQCRYMYQDRVIGIKRICTSLYGRRGYLYLCVDYNSRNDQIRKFTQDAIGDKLPRGKWSTHTDKMGFFALVSPEKIEAEELLPLYYTRQTVEQVFDVSKNNVHILPLRTHSEETFKGHVMLTFMATILYLKLNQWFKGHKVFTAQNSLIEMRNLKCKVYDRCVLVKEMTRDMREICKILGIQVPEKISLPINHL
jgi:transposase